jgi:4-carboxymuconolactone decarboxylase
MAIGEAPAFENLPSRLDLIPPADLTDGQRAVYEAITGGPRASQAGTVPVTDESGRLLGPFAVMLLTPEVGNAMQQVGAKIRFSTGLSERQRELGILAVAGTLRCDFERLAHEPAALRAGLTQAQVNAVLAGQVPAGLADDEALTCKLAQVMATERNLPDGDYEAGTAALGRERLAELTWLVGYYSALALSLAVFRPFLPESFTAARDGVTVPEARSRRPLAEVPAQARHLQDRGTVGARVRRQQRGLVLAVEREGHLTAGAGTVRDRDRRAAGGGAERQRETGLYRAGNVLADR